MIHSKGKKKYFKIVKLSIHQEDIFIPYFHVFNISSKQAKLKGKIDISTIRVGDINDLFSWTGSKKTDFKKINKDRESELTDVA